MSDLIIIKSDVIKQAENLAYKGVLMSDFTIFAQSN